MKNEKFDIAKLMEDLTDSEKASLYGFILGLKENRGEKKADESAKDGR